MFWVAHQFRRATSVLVVRVRSKIEIQHVEGTYRLKRTCIVKKIRDHSTLIAIHLPGTTAPLSTRYSTMPTCIFPAAISRGGFWGWNRNRFNYRKVIIMDTCTTESFRNWLPFEQVESDFTTKNWEKCKVLLFRLLKLWIKTLWFHQALHSVHVIRISSVLTTHTEWLLDEWLKHSAQYIYRGMIEHWQHGSWVQFPRNVCFSLPLLYRTTSWCLYLKMRQDAQEGHRVASLLMERCFWLTMAHTQCIESYYY